MKLFFSLILSVFIHFFFVFNASANEDVELALKILKIACVTGEEFKIEGNAEGGISILKKGGEGQFSFSKSEIRGFLGKASDVTIHAENRNIRECMQPHIQSILNILANSKQYGPGPEGQATLPKNQWMPVKTPLPILDGKVIVVIEDIHEYRRNNRLSVRVEVPKRKPYVKKLTDAKYLKFKYFDHEYKLTATNIQLQNERAQITINPL